jgi:hypothetical protein
LIVEEKWLPKKKHVSSFKAQGAFLPVPPGTFFAQNIRVLIMARMTPETFLVIMAGK